MKFEQMFSLKGKTAVVTGGARGIGMVVARHMADAGADIALIDLPDSAAERTAKEIGDAFGVKTGAYFCDVTKPDEVSKTIDRIAWNFNGLDILFNNAGICQHKSALEVTPEEWLKVIDVNLNGVFFVAAAFAKKLIALKKTGGIINTASMSGHIVNIPQQQASYNASKAAVVHLTKSLAVEWINSGIRVNCISPGYIFTEMTASVAKEMTDAWTGMIPCKRMGTPEELAGAVIYLASDCAAYTSGCDIVIDGCFTCV